MFLPGAADGVLNGTTPVTVVAAPGAATQRMIRMVTVYNADTAAVTGFVQYVNGASVRGMFKFVLNPGETFRFGDVGDLIVLDAATKSLKIVLSGAIVTTQPDWTAHWADNS